MDVEKPSPLKISEFSKKIHLLTREGLSVVVKTISKMCPRALQDLDSEKWILKEEKLDETTLTILRRYIINIYKF
jgi:hypothetical protein